MIDLKTGEVNIYKCRACVRQNKTLFDVQLYYKHLPNAMEHLIKKHGLTEDNIKRGTPKLWTYWLEHIHYTIPEDKLNELNKAITKAKRLKEEAHRVGESHSQST